MQDFWHDLSIMVKWAVALYTTQYSVQQIPFNEVVITFIVENNFEYVTTAAWLVFRTRVRQGI